MKAVQLNVKNKKKWKLRDRQPSISHTIPCNIYNVYWRVLASFLTSVQLIDSLVFFVEMAIVTDPVQICLQMSTSCPLKCVAFDTQCTRRAMNARKKVKRRNIRKATTIVHHNNPCDSSSTQQQHYQHIREESEQICYVGRCRFCDKLDLN